MRLSELASSRESLRRFVVRTADGDWPVHDLPFIDEMIVMLSKLLLRSTKPLPEVEEHRLEWQFLANNIRRHIVDEGDRR